MLLTARATGQIDAAPFVSARALGTALARFEPSDPHEALRTLVAAVEAAHSGTLGTPTADEEVQALDDASTDVVSDYEYQEVARHHSHSAARTNHQVLYRPLAIPTGAAAALAAAAFAAGAAVAIQSSRSAAARATNMTEVIIAPLADTGRRPVDPSPRGADRSHSSESSKPPAGAGRTPQKPLSPPMPAPLRETAP